MLRMVLTRNTIAATIAVACALTACGDTSQDHNAGTTASSGSEEARVLATTSIWADITSSVLCGEDVPALIPRGADPHTFEPSLRDRERLENAEIVIANGGGLEDSFADLLTTIATDTNLVEVAPFVDTIVSDSHGHDHGGETDDDHDDHDEDAESDADHDEHGHGLAIDPHIWQDPRRVDTALDVIVSATRALDIDDCVDEYSAELAALDDEIVQLLADIPPSDRVMVTSHDSLAYFADRYDIEIVGTVIPSTNTLAQTNAADLAALADLIEERNVRVIFTEELESTADADQLAERLGVEVIPLVTDALTNDPETDTYLEMMRSNATLIAQALTP